MLVVFVVVVVVLYSTDVFVGPRHDTATYTPVPIANFTVTELAQNEQSSLPILRFFSHMATSQNMANSSIRQNS